jgi:hypothetical protein
MINDDACVPALMLQNTVSQVRHQKRIFQIRHEKTMFDLSMQHGLPICLQHLNHEMTK